MNLKLSKAIGIIVIFILCFIFHFLYELLPIVIFKILFPINESIWEHMKLLFIPFVIYTIFEYYFINKKQNNIYLQLFLVSIFGIATYLSIYLPIYNIIGENMLVSISLLLGVIILQQFISYKLALEKEIDFQKIIGIVGLIIVFLVFIYLTYCPLDSYIFIPN